MIHIYKEGEVIASCKDIGGIRRRVATKGVDTVQLQKIEETTKGELRIIFGDMSVTTIPFENFALLCAVVAHWKNLRYAELYVNGINEGEVQMYNPALVKYGYWGGCTCHTPTALSRRGFTGENIGPMPTHRGY